LIYLIFWTTFAPLSLILQIFGKVFSNSFVISQWYRNMIYKSIFQVFENSPPISNAFSLAK
jgi:hypothetical protein